MQDWALAQALSGEKFEGFKLVSGRSVRKYSDTDLISEKLISAGFAPEIIFEKNLLTLSALEKAPGKKKVQETLGDLIIKPEGKPTLVENSDRREEFNSINSAVMDFV